MTQRGFFLLFFSLMVTISYAQKSVDPLRPKLVVGVVVDQMRWDFLYRYSDRYKAGGGFRRLLDQGFSNENTFIPYTPTITACGHTCIYTGSVPAIHGIIGNNWFDPSLARMVYCTEDRSVKTVGATNASGEMSPRNLFTTTIADELRLASNFRSKVVGLAIKDRGAILPAGHSANCAYWYDNKSGNWISSTYYRDSLAAWVTAYNNKKNVDTYYAQGWSTLYPANSYSNSTADEEAYEANPFGKEQKGFPYDLKSMAGKNYGAVSFTPFGNTMTLQMAMEAVKAESLGKSGATDMLTISLSSTDYIGHAFGPNSIEMEDTYLRLDQDLGAFLQFLDQQIGKDQYLFFLSADHGVAHIPAFLKEHKIPAGLMDDQALLKEINSLIGKEFGQDKLVSNLVNYQVYLNHKLIDSVQLDYTKISKKVIGYLKQQPSIADAFSLAEVSQATLPASLRERVVNGYNARRSGDIQFILLPQYIDGGATGTTHGLWNPYDAHIPLVWYGWKIKPGKSNQEVYMTDIAPTIAALLKIQMPNGCTGKPIETVIR